MPALTYRSAPEGMRRWPVTPTVTNRSGIDLAPRGGQDPALDRLGWREARHDQIGSRAAQLLHAVAARGDPERAAAVCARGGHVVRRVSDHADRERAQRTTGALAVAR